MTKLLIFLTLEEAVNFITDHLDSGEAGELAAQFTFSGRGSLPSNQYTRQHFVGFVFADLLRRHQELDLRQRYQGRQFPETEDWLTLGGHDAELGHIHIIFTRLPEGWVLDEIMMCR